MELIGNMNHKEWCKKYYQEHREELLTKQKKYSEEHKEQIKIYAQQYLQSEHGKQVIAKWEVNNRERIYERDRNYRKVLRQEVLTYYGGGKCACVRCGIDDIRVLSIDHIKSNGKEHRQKMKDEGINSIYRWLKKKGYPEGYQTLCMNCQWIKRYENNETRNCSHVVYV